MNEEQWKVIGELRDAGYAVCIFNPDELRGAPRNRVEDRMCEMGWDVINILSDDPDPEEDL